MKNFANLIALCACLLFSFQVSAQCDFPVSACADCVGDEISTTVDLTDASIIWSSFDPTGLNPVVFDQATNTGTLTLGAGQSNTFTVLQMDPINIPANATNVCLTADVNVTGGVAPIIVDFRIETVALGFGGPKLEFNGVSNLQGACAMGGDNTNGMASNGWAFPGTPGPYRVVFALTDFTGNPIAEDVVVDVSNIVLSYCASPDPICELEAAACASCVAGESSTTIDLTDAANATWIPFDPTGGGNPISFNQGTNSGSITLSAGGANTFGIVQLEPITIPADATSLCMSVDVDVVEGVAPINIDFRIETVAGGFGGPRLEFNQSSTGLGACSLGGDNLNGSPVNGWAFPGTPGPYRIVIGVTDFSGAPLAEDVTVDFSNISLSYCSTAPACTLMSAACEACGADELSTVYDLAAAPFAWFGFDGGSGAFGAVDQANNAATINMPSGVGNNFAGFGIAFDAAFEFPENVTDACFTADIDVLSGNVPFTLEMRLEGPAGFVIVQNATVDGNGVCSIGGPNATQMGGNLGFGMGPYTIAFAVETFSTGPLTQDLIIDVSNIQFSVCSALAPVPCTLMSDACVPCPAGSDLTVFDLTNPADASWIGFEGNGPAAPIVDQTNNTGTIIMPAGIPNAFAGIAIDLVPVLPANINEACFTADIDVISGQTPFLLEVRLEGDGDFQNPILNYNVMVDGDGMCSIGGPVASNMGGTMNFTASSYTLVFAVPTFVSGPLPEDVEVVISNVQFQICAPPPPVDCTLMSGSCTPCATGACGFGEVIDIAAAGTVFNDGGELGPAFDMFNQNPPTIPNFDGTMGTLMLEAGLINAFVVSGVSDLTIPDPVDDLCIMADINVISGQTPFLIEFRIENGTGAPGNGGQALVFDALVDGDGMCSIGGSLDDGTPVNGFQFIPGANYSVVIALPNFTGNPVPEDIVVDVSNFSFTVCSSTDATHGALEIKSVPSAGN